MVALRSRPFRGLLLCCLIVTLGCAGGGGGEGPGHRSQRLGLTPQQEYDLGVNAFAEILKKYPVVPDGPAHSSYVAFNVLEHIPDHVGALRAAHRLVRPGGRVIMLVPAFEFAMSEFDRRVGHVRRYTKRSLAQAYRDAGLELERLHYVNAPGLPAWFVGMRLLGMTPGDGALLRIWDSVVVPCARAVESRVRPPFGQSVFAVGVVPERRGDGRSR